MSYSPPHNSIVPDSPSTLTFVDGSCGTLPTATISCDGSQNDYFDFRQAKHYSFDSVAGVMRDTGAADESVVMQTGDGWFGASSACVVPSIHLLSTCSSPLLVPPPRTSSRPLLRAQRS